MFAAIGMEAFGERAGRELLATGDSARRRAADTKVLARLGISSRRQLQLALADSGRDGPGA